MVARRAGCRGPLREAVTGPPYELLTDSTLGVSFHPGRLSRHSFILADTRVSAWLMSELSFANVNHSLSFS